MTEPRKQERPWRVEEMSTAFIVRTATGLMLAQVNFDTEMRRRSFMLSKDEARRVAANIARLPELLSKVP